MHQHPRVPPVTASPARSPQTNPMRSNNPRDPLAMHSRQNSENSPAPSEQGISMTERNVAAGSSKDPDPMDRLSMIVQNYFYKAALIILDARTRLPQAYTSKDKEPRVNRWFNIEIPETQILTEHTSRWRKAGAVTNRPPNMVIETYIDLQDLSSNQKLVVLDDYGKRWDVETALRDAYDGYDAPGELLREHSIVLERWTLQLGPSMAHLEENLPLEKVLPKVYKNSIILYRSLYARLRMMPAWRFHKRTGKGLVGQSMPKLKWRVFDPAQRENDGRPDELAFSLFTGQPQVTDEQLWDPVDSPAGQFSIKVNYRTNCEFRIDTPESLFNSHFMAHDEQLFEPSLPQSGVLGSRQPAVKPRPSDMGSLPSEHKDLLGRKKLDEIAQQGPAYGSMSTFHTTGGKIGTSPLTALRAARDLYSRSPTESPPQPAPPETRPTSGSNASLRSNEAPGTARRTSISFQPFKSPAFSSSVPADHAAPASPRISGSMSRPSPLAQVNEARYPAGATPVPTSPRTSPRPTDAVPVPAIAGSPRPAPARFSSSFSHRRNRQSVGGTSSRTEDEGSSGRGSVSSSNVQTGPQGEPAPSNSLQADDENISEFLKMLDQKKDLKSLSRPTPGATGSGSQPLRGTTAALSKFQQLRDSHVALSESISSSQMLQRSSVSSASRQLANVPPMVAGNSASVSSSPGERISPRTPHTPAIPSRLSSNSIIEYNQDARRPRSHRYSTGEDAAVRESTEEHEDHAGRGGPSAGAIPIPTSPRPFGPVYRRSSSVHANHQTRDRARNDRYDVTEDLDMLPFALRSASMGDGEEREPLSLSALVRMQDTSGPIPTGVLPPASELDHHDLGGVESPIRDATGSGRGEIPTRSMSYRGRGHGRVSSLAQEERAISGTAPSVPTSRPGTGRSGSGSAEGRPSRHSFTRQYGQGNFEDDEPLLFAMSEQLEGSGGNSGQGGRASGSGSGSASGQRRMAQW